MVVVVEPVPSTVVQTKALLKNLNEQDFSRDKVFVVLVNRARLEISLPNTKVAHELGVELGGVIMPAPEIAYQAGLRYDAIVTHQPDSIPSRQYMKLAETLLQNKMVKI